MRPKSLILLALALGCGLVASIGISQVMESRADQGPPEETQLVLVAMTRIDRNTELTAQNLKLDALPLDKVPPRAITKLEEVEGHRPSTVIYPGSVILEQMIGSGEGVRATTQIPDGMRVVSVRVDNTSGAGLIRPGDRVDVQVYARKNPREGIPEAGTWTFLQDVSVFAVDAIISDDNATESLTAKTISLLVSPEQAARVSFASEIGTIRLVMRAPTDKTEAEQFNVSIRDIIGATEKLGEKKTAQKSESKEPTVDAGLAAFLDKQQQAQDQMQQRMEQVLQQVQDRAEQQTPQAEAIVSVREPVQEEPKATPNPVRQPEEWRMKILSGLDVRENRFRNGQQIKNQSRPSGGTSFRPAPVDYDERSDDQGKATFTPVN